MWMWQWIIILLIIITIIIIIIIIIFIIISVLAVLHSSTIFQNTQVTWHLKSWKSKAA